MVTAAIRTTEAENSKLRNVEVAFAFCSPKQGQKKRNGEEGRNIEQETEQETELEPKRTERPYTKKVGRNIAATRLGGSRAVRVLVDESVVGPYTVAFCGLAEVLAIRDADKVKYTEDLLKELEEDGIDLDVEGLRELRREGVIKAFSHWVPHWLVVCIKGRDKMSPLEMANVIRDRWEKERNEFLKKREEDRIARRQRMARKSGKPETNVETEADGGVDKDQHPDAA